MPKQFDPEAEWREYISECDLEGSTASEIALMKSAFIAGIASLGLHLKSGLTVGQLQQAEQATCEFIERLEAQVTEMEQAGG